VIAENKTWGMTAVTIGNAAEMPTQAVRRSR